MERIGFRAGLSVLSGFGTGVAEEPGIDSPNMIVNDIFRQIMVHFVGTKPVLRKTCRKADIFLQKLPVGQEIHCLPLLPEWFLYP